MLWSREGQVAAVLAALDRGREGGGGTLVLEGPAGSGLSRLLDEGVERAAGYQVLRARAAADEADIPYAVLQQLLEPLEERWATALSPAQREALEVALGHRPPGSEPVAVAPTLLRTVSLLAAETPVLVVVDDVHWADAHSARALAFLARRTATTPVVVLLARADGHGDDAGLWSSAGQVVDVTALEEADVRAWVEAALPDADGAARQRVVRASAGLPRRVADLVSIAARAEDRSRPLAGLLTASVVTSRRVRAQLASLSPRTRLVLLAHALGPASGHGRLAEVLGVLGVLGAGPGAREQVLDELEAVGVLTSRAGRSGAARSRVDPLLSEAVVASTPTAAQRDVHAAWSTVLAPTHPDLALRHQLEAQAAPAEDVLRSVLPALDRLGAEDLTAAVDLGELAAGRASGALRDELLVRTAELAWLAGRHARCDELLGAVTAGAGTTGAGNTTVRTGGAEPAALLGAREHLCALRAYADDDPAAAARHLARAAALRAGDDPDGTASDLVLHHLLLRRSDSTHLPGPSEAPPATVRGAPAHPVVEALAALAQPWDAVPAARRQEAFTAVLALVRTRAVPASGLLVDVAVLLGRDEELLAAVDARLEALRGTDVGLALADAHLARAGVLLWRGSTPLAERALAGARRAAGAQGILLVTTAVTRLGLLVTTLTSPSVQAVGVPDADGHGPHTADGPGAGALGAVRWRRAHTAAWRGDLDSARTELLGLWPAQGASRGGWAAALSTAPDLVAYLVRLPERPAALDAVLAEVSAWSRGTGAPVARCADALCRGMAASDPREQEALLTRAAAVLDAPAYFQARAHLWLGESLRRARRGVAARSHLERALHLFSDHGYTALAQRAQLELAATAPQRPGRTVGSKVLTAQEQRVAALAGDGLSNAQIAAALDISSRTVAHHLQRVYAKTGAAGRRDLAGSAVPRPAEGAAS